MYVLPLPFSHRLAFFPAYSTLHTRASTITSSSRQSVMQFQPKQITKCQAQHLAALQGDLREHAIRFILGLLPLLRHPGAGTLSTTMSAARGLSLRPSWPCRRRQASTPPIPPMSISSLYRALLPWLPRSNEPVDTAVMSAQDLTFADSRFTHSFTKLRLPVFR